MELKDTVVLQGRRKLLIEKIKNRGITDENVLNAMLKVPRHFFIMPGLEFMAYEDKAIGIDDKQTISQPFTVAFQSQLLNVKKGDKVLEIGTGSGYQAAILAELGAEVYSIERIKNLHEKATKLLNKLGYNVKTFYDDGHIGLPQFAPFDAIIVTAALKEIPKDLLKQLKINGRFVAPVGNDDFQQMVRITRKSETNFSKEVFGNFVFVPMLKGKK